MKKILVCVAAVALAWMTPAFAAGSYDVFSKLNDRSTLNSMKKYLQTNYSQEDNLQYVFTLTEKKLKTAKDDSGEIDKALRFNLANMKAILTPEQYKKYLVVLNLSIYNQGAAYVAE